MEINLKKTEDFEIYTKIDGTPIRIQLKNNILTIEENTLKFNNSTTPSTTKNESNKTETTKPYEWWNKPWVASYPNDVTIKPLQQDIIYTAKNSEGQKWTTSC